MSILRVEVEEYVFLNQYLQGNINVSGLIFNDMVQSSLHVKDPVWMVWTEEVVDSVGVNGSFAPVHDCLLLDLFNFEEIKLGLPVRVGAFHVDVVHSPDVYPIDCCFFQVDILHGVDTFYEENIESIEFFSDGHFSEVFWSYCYESIGLEFENGDANKAYACYKAVSMATADRINLRHSVVQEYYFNSKAFDYFFAWDTPTFGWGKFLADGFKADHSIKGAYGRQVNEAITPKLTLSSNWTGQQILDARMFLYDQTIFEKFYAKLLEETIGLAAALEIDARMLHTALEQLSVGETVDPVFQRFLEAVERLAVSEALRVTFGQQPEIVEALTVQGHPEILRAMPQVLADTMTMLDDPVTKWLAMVMVDEITNLRDEAMR